MAQAAAPRSRAVDLLPWAAGSVGLGALSSGWPLAAAGVGAVAASAFLPWLLLFAGLAVAVTVQGSSATVAGATVRPEIVLVAIFALRAFTLKERARFERVEWTLIAFMLVQVLSSLMHSVDAGASFRSVGLLGFGALAYLSTYTVMCDPQRILAGIRVFLGIGVLGAAAGIAALVSHYAIGTLFGVTSLETLGGFPAATGFAYEHDLFGSTSAAAAIAFLVLWRERNRAFSPRLSALGFWVCFAGTLLSLARGAWAGVAVAMVAVWLTSREALLGMVKVVLYGALILGIGALLFVSFVSRDVTVGASTAGAVSSQAGHVFDLATATGAQRLIEWETSLSEVRRSPILGLGTNSYGQRHFDMTRFGTRPAFVGNWFVRTLYDSGLVGLFLLMAFAGPIVWPGARVRRARGELAPETRALVLGCLVLVVAYLATDSLLLVWPWVLLGLTRAARVVSEA